MTSLRRADPAEPGIRRRRCGRGFSYRTPDGSMVDARTRTRIEELAIPPAWEQVWICADPDSHLLATGVDAAGRTQYLYHPQWRMARDAEKFERVVALGRELPRLRRRLRRELAAWSRGPAPRAAVESLALLLLDTGSLRIGSETYEQENGSHGAATLLVRHVKRSGGRTILQFPAKGGDVARVALRDALLASRVSRLARDRAADAYLLSFHDGDAWQHLTSALVSERFHDLAGPDFAVKDLRTWAATVAAAESLAKRAGEGPQAREGRVREAIADAAEALGDTVPVARDSYVHPRLLATYETTGRTVGRTRGPVLQHSPAVRRRVERELLQLLDGS
ncbi:MAG TPA: DNA topoisomerase IB [Flexivirga sp.]|uniref:DNA topoisomerase IB n=1 Tax=Flexivirga sp. TaxID=1962927 RepID=UPI002B7B77DA|nr:DNA topoisomerase IB [Flexivirga sp.]HWC21752.1 DNA topoisomerase IB [Flexivirga sp.]